MSNFPQISIIIPVFQVETYIEECLNSVVTQSYQHLEIIIVDDGSKDQSGMICDKFAAQDHRIRVFHTENHGLSAARNIGLEEAKGDWIGFVDGDDWIEPEMYEKMVTAAEKTGADLCICGHIRKDYKCTAIPSVSEEQLLFGEEEKVKTFISDIIISPYVWNKLYRRDLFTDIRFPEGRKYEDIGVTFTTLMKAEKIVCIPECLYNYRIRTGSIVRTHSLKNECDRWISFREVYSPLSVNYPQYRRKAISKLIFAGWSVWCYTDGNSKEEQKACAAQLEEISIFARKHTREVFFGEYQFWEKVKIILERYRCPLIFWILYHLVCCQNRIKTA